MNRTKWLIGTGLGLVLLLGVFLWLWGLPLTAAQASPAAIPLLVDPVLSPTDRLTQTITGETAPSATVEIACEGGWFVDEADDAGRFAIVIDLLPGATNHLDVWADDGLDWTHTTVDRNGDPLEIVQDAPPPPTLTLAVDPVASPTDLPTQTITGQTTPWAYIEILCEEDLCGGWGAADEAGYFAIEVELAPGVVNRLVVTALDWETGMYASTTVDRNGDPLDIVQTSAPPALSLLVDPVTSPTDRLTQTITGETEPEAVVGILCEEEETWCGGWGEADENGEFAVEIDLEPGVLNRLTVFAVSAQGEISTTVDRNGDPLEILQTSGPPSFALLVDPVTSPTDQLSQTVTGQAAPGAYVGIECENEDAWCGGEGEADEDGEFAVEVALTPGTVNSLIVWAFTEQEWISTTVDRNGDPLQILQTSMPVSLTLLVDPVDSPTDRFSQTITGETEPWAEIAITCEADGWCGGWGEADASGTFTAQVILAPGAINTLTVWAFTATGWISTPVDRNGDPLVIVQTSAPPSVTLLVDPVTSPTDQPTQTITGETIPGAYVEVIGEGDWNWDEAGPDGSFALEIGLLPGAVNHLTVTAFTCEDEISTTVDRNGDPLVIVQTSAPPSATLLVDPVDSPTDRLTQTITGETEPGAYVEIECQETFDAWCGGWGEADEDGRFAVEVALIPGATNALTVGVLTTYDWLSTTVDRNGDPLVIIQTTPPPSLTLLVDPVDSPTDQLTQTITGETAPGAYVEVLGEGDWQWAEADPDGSFALEIGLMPGITNHLLVAAYTWDAEIDTEVDRNGDPLEIVQTSDPFSLPLAVDPISPTAGAVEQTISGRTMPDTTVRVGWEGGTAQSTSNASGQFSVGIRLVANTVNHITVHAFHAETGRYTQTTKDATGNPLRVVPVTTGFTVFLPLIQH